MTTNKVKASPQKKEKGEKITLLRPPFKLKTKTQNNKLYEYCKHWQKEGLK